MMQLHYVRNAHAKYAAPGARNNTHKRAIQQTAGRRQALQTKGATQTKTRCHRETRANNINHTPTTDNAMNRRLCFNLRQHFKI